MKRIITIKAILFLFILQSPSLVQAQNLFRYLDEKTTALTAQQTKFLKAIKERSTSVKVNLVQFDNLHSLLTSQSISGNLPTSLMKANLRYLDQSEDNSLTWTGNPAHQEGSIFLTVTGNDVTGMIHSRNTVFAIEPLGKGLHTLIYLDQSKFGPDEPSDAYSVDKMNRNETTLDKVNEKPSPALSAQTNPVIDVLVVYTPAAASASGNIDNLISASISTTKSICANSGADASVKKVYSTQVNYTESGNLQTDVIRLQGNGDGYMDNVHSLRDQYGADVIVLLVVPLEMLVDGRME